MQKSSSPATSQNPEVDSELTAIVGEETQCLERVLDHLRIKSQQKPKTQEIDYDSQLISLRDQIANARLEDVPPLLEQMERIATLAARHRVVVDGWVDPTSPYFGRMVLSENERTREVLIGRSTYLDAESGVRIVDWRDAPISRLFYRYEEGEDYVEVFGGRETEGEVATRRSLAISEGVLRRIVSPQGSFVYSVHGEWKRSGASTKLTGGQGSALRAEDHHRPGKLGVQGGDGREDKHLKEITALIDPRQFDLITRPDSGLVVIQGGAGSGKTTIGLHRLAYLAFQDKRRFRPDKMLIVVFNDALARYVARVLPALGVSGVQVRTYEEWASRLRLSHVQGLPKDYSDDTPTEVTRLKKHPLMLDAIEHYVTNAAREIMQELESALANSAESIREPLIEQLKHELNQNRPLVYRLHTAERLLNQASSKLAASARVAAEATLNRGLARAKDVISAWADIISDLPKLLSLFAGEHEEGSPASRIALSPEEIQRAHKWCARQADLVLDAMDHHAEAKAEEEATQAPNANARFGHSRFSDAKGERRSKAAPRAAQHEEEPDEEFRAVDGGDYEDTPEFDREDDTLILRLIQRLRGPLMRPKSNEALTYEHILIDEAQDLSPVELAAVVGTVSRSQSITLAGDVAQRLHMDNGFTGWDDTLAKLDLRHVQVEPLKLSYRSTAQILEFAREVLGPLASDEVPEATRFGAPVELFRFAHSGDAVAFLSESLRALMGEEPACTVAVIARYPEQADIYYEGLKKGEVPYLRRIAQQDFPFRAGVDVTDVRQVKGLEFDYVILLDVNQSTYPEDAEARHLLHIAATRAAHQLWVIVSGKPSQLLPAELRDRGY